MSVSVIFVLLISDFRLNLRAGADYHFTFLADLVLATVVTVREAAAQLLKNA